MLSFRQTQILGCFKKTKKLRFIGFGGIGRRARFKIWFFPECRFESVMPKGIKIKPVV